MPNAGYTWPLSNSMAPLGALPTAPSCVRSHIRTTLCEWRMMALTDVAELVGSELVTNAVRASTDEHGHPFYLNGRMAVIFVRLLANHTRLVLEVWDLVPTLPMPCHVEPDTESGRGLELVEALAFAWSWKTTPSWPGKCVWAELRL
jgi:hypothetical protein